MFSNHWLKRPMLALAAVTALAIGPSTPAQAQDKLTIGAIIYARDSQFWQQIERGMRDAAEKYGATIQFGLNQRKLPTESQVVEDFITRGVDVLIMPPLDKQGSVASARRAKDRGIMVIEYDTKLEDASIASHTIGVDSRELAASVGKELRRYLETVEGEPSIGMITLPPINANMQPRRMGFLSALDGLKYELVAEVTAATPEDGADGLENILRRKPDTTAIWASNAGSLAGAAAAARRANTKTKLYGIDMSQDLAHMLLDPDSNVEAVSDQQPYKVGYLTVETAVKAKRGEAQPRHVNVPVKLYTKTEPQAVKEYLELVRSLSQ
ncbi:sugar ABC transporter substrate-binding protein [Rhodoligotrophos defluvii]|uniref:sugar ABC transporter substrate-binding protein n=1 Tax=Rhodoligotrophos defluvii TaxID=2561934 RepID=UPI001485650C|nr:substrate-binding domain-containing protein [Rhodoligotrophos defluvii]